MHTVQEGAKKPSSEMVTKYVQLWGQEEARTAPAGGAEAEGVAGGGAVVGGENGAPRVVDSDRGG